MTTNSRVPGRHAASLFLFVLASTTLAADPIYSPDIGDFDTSKNGCGKSDAARRVFEHVPEADDMVNFLEPLSDTDILHYDLDIEISNINTAANTCTITGQNRITIQSKSTALSTFTLRLRSQYTITSLLINDVTPVSFTTDSTTTRSVTLNRAYGFDEVFTLTVGYTGNTVSVGFGSIEVRNHSGSAVVSTLSEPYYSYSWWPVKDGDVFLPGDNSDKATADISIVAPNNLVVASNGLLQSIDVLSGNRKRYNWSTAYPMATYLASFSISNYTTWSVDYVHASGTMPVDFFIYPENDTPGNRLAWERVVDMLGVFASKYGEYPFVDEKYGIYNFPFGGGMEHQTMTGQCCFSEGLSAHELAHQWWGNDVTCRTWNDIWLNEGFATYSECIWEEFKNGGDNLGAYLSAIVARKPGNVGDSVYVYDTSSVGRIFDGDLSYRKGAWVLHQLRHVVGDVTFFQILADYRAAYANSAATTDDFVALASATSGQDLSGFFDQWVYQIGAPEYVYAWDWVQVGDQKYLHVTIDQTQIPSYPDVFVMPVDLVATIGGTPQTLVAQNTSRSQRFVFQVASPVTNVQFDPQQWILRTSATQEALVVGDMDGDLDVDRHDHAEFITCLTGPDGGNPGGCDNVDYDGDQDIDMHDWVGLQTSFSGCLIGCP